MFNSAFCVVGIVLLVCAVCLYNQKNIQASLACNALQTKEDGKDSAAKNQDRKGACRTSGAVRTDEKDKKVVLENQH